jgi:hypothetical protein
VTLLSRNRIRNGEILIRTAKNGKAVKLPVHPELQSALDTLPPPREASDTCQFFFWSGNGSERAFIRDATRTMATVFTKSGLDGVCSHRSRPLTRMAASAPRGFPSRLYPGASSAKE